MIKNYILLSLISLIWGSQFALNKILLTTFSPLWVAFLRVLLGLFTLIIILLFSKKKKVVYRKEDYLLFLAIGLLESAIPLNLMLWGQQKISSSIAGILISTVPIWVMIISFFLSSKKINSLDLVSVVMGFLGVIILLIDGEDGAFSFFRAGALLLAAFSFACAILLIDNSLKKFPPLIATRNILLSAAISLFLVVSFSGQFSEILKVEWDLKIAITLFLIGVFCTGLVWLAYTQLIQRTGAAFTAMANYMMPAFGIIFGFLFFGESLDLRKISALGLIVFALFFKQFLQKTKS